MIVFTVEVHAFHIFPRLVCNFVREHSGRLMLQIGDGLRLQVNRDIVIKDILRTVYGATLALSRVSVKIIPYCDLSRDAHVSYLTIHPWQRLSTQHFEN